MRTSTRWLSQLLAAGLLLAGPALAGSMPATAASPHGFDELKALAGNWQGKTAEGKVTRISYEVEAGGTAVVERLHGEGEPSMVTVYYPDGDRLMLTHYCTLGNHPRLRSEPPAAGSQVTFAFLDGTNMKSAGEAHMHRLKVTFRDKDHFSQEWTMRQEGKEISLTTEFERVR